MAEAPFSPIVVYATMFGATEAVAERVAAALAAAFACEAPCHDVAWLDLKTLEAHDPIVLGTSTWNVGQLPSDWEARIAELRALDLRGKRVAVFGTGDQRGYPDTFVDALDDVARAALAAGATLVGAWPGAGYRFTASRASRGDVLVGLALDEDGQPELTATRVAAWTALVSRACGAHPPAEAVLR